MNKFTQAKLASTAPFVQVTSTIGDYDQGAVLTKPADIADYWREMAELGGVTLVIDDDTIIEVQQSIPGQPATVDSQQDADLVPASDWETEVCGALLSRNKGNAPITPRAPQTLPDTTQQATNRTATARFKTGSVALLAGLRWDKSEAFRTHLHEAAYAPEKVKRAPFDVLMAMLAVENVTVSPDGMPSESFKSMELWGYPDPESKPDEAYDKAWKSNGTVRREDENRFAEYQRDVGDGTLETYDWYEKAFDQTTLGKDIIAHLKDIKAARKPSGNTGAVAAGPHKDRSPNWVEGQFKLWKGRQTSGIRAMKSVMSALHMWKAITDEPTLSKNVAVGFVMDHPDHPKAQISDGFVTIFIGNKAASIGAQASTPYTLTSFANLDLGKALENGGTYGALRDSVKRGPKEKKVILKPVARWEIEDFLQNVSALRGRFTTTFVNELKQKANDKSGKPPQRTEAAKLLIDDVCTIVTQLQSFYSMFGGATWNAIEKELKDKEDAANAEAAKTQGIDTDAA